MKPAMIPWEIRGRRLVDGALHEQHVAVGFGPTAKAAIAWARRNEPAQMSSFPDADLRAIPDPVSAPLPVVSSLLASLGFLACVCAADGGQTISAGFSETHPDARATRAGAGMVACPMGTRFDSSRHKTAGPADSISVASRTDEKRALGTDILRNLGVAPAGHGVVAVSNHAADQLHEPSPTENSSPSPEVFLVGLSADLPSYSTRGVGSFAPAVGGNRTDLRAQRGLREETGPWADPVEVVGRTPIDPRNAAGQGVTAGETATGPAAHSSRARNLASVAVAGNGATAVSIERRSEQNRTGVTEGETSLSFDRDLWAGIGLALGAAGILGIAFARLDRLDREESARRVRHHWNNLSTPTPGALRDSRPTAPSGNGERRGFFYGTSTPAETKATHSKEMSAENT